MNRFLGIIYRISKESILQAIQQLTGNKLRSFLSLLGITIGIFCIISVKSAVDSLEKDIKSSMEQLGNDVLYITKMPWNQNPSQNYWKYARRPSPDHDDYTAIRSRVEEAAFSALSVFIDRETIKYRSSSVEGALLIAVTQDYAPILDIHFQSGRFFSLYEYQSASPKIVVGHEVAQNLFPNVDAVGKTVKLSGRSMQIIGVVEQSGDALINPVNFDNVIFVSYPMAERIANLDNANIFGTNLMVKAKQDVTVEKLKDEVTYVLRAERLIKPTEQNNFAINQLSIIKDLLDQLFSVLNIAGFVIGIFAIIVGAFSVANIMFVSVKERTSIIGIKKAIGAKNYVILLEILIESVILCIIGGAIGLLMVIGVLEIVSSFVGFDMFLSTVNIILGLVISVLTGLISGFIPAFIASRLDPVDAIRS